MVKSGSVKNSQLELKTVAGWLQFRWVHGNARTALLFPSNHLSCLQPSAVLVLEGKVAGSSEADVGIKVPPHRGSKPLLNPCSDGTSDGVAVFLSFFFLPICSLEVRLFSDPNHPIPQSSLLMNRETEVKQGWSLPYVKSRGKPIVPTARSSRNFLQLGSQRQRSSTEPQAFVLPDTHTHTWGLQRRMWAVGTLPTDPSSWPFGLPQTWLWVTSCPIPACGHLHWWSPQEARRRGSRVLFGDKGAASHKQKGCIAFAFRIAEQKRELHPCIKKDIVYWF